MLDASAVLAFLLQEPGSERVATALAQGDCAISAVNLSEVAGKLADTDLRHDEIISVLRDLDLRVYAFDQAQALECVWLRGLTRDTGLSLGGRACLALATQLSRPVLTADRAWEGLTLEISIDSLRP